MRPGSVIGDPLNAGRDGFITGPVTAHRLFGRTGDLRRIFLDARQPSSVSNWTQHHYRADNAHMRGKSRRQRIATMSEAKRGDLAPLTRKVHAACAVMALLALVSGCGGGSKSTAYQAPPLVPPGEDTPSTEVSRNLALALGPNAVDPISIKEKHEQLPPELVSDRANAIYSGQTLTGSSAAPAATSTPAPPSAPPPSAPPPSAPPPSAPPAPVVAKAPPVMPPIPAKQQAAPAAIPAAPPTSAPPPSAAKPPRIESPAPVANVSNADRAMVQLAAYRTPANAERGWQRLRAAHPDQLGDRSLTMREVDLGDRGIYYRVRTGPFTDVAAAKEFCTLMLARDQDCLVIPRQQ